MADTSLGRLALVNEASVGVTPATPSFKLLDFVSESMKLNKNFIRSNSVAASRVVRASRSTGQSTDGSIVQEFVRGPETDELLEALLCDDFTANVAKAGGSTILTKTFERQISASMFRRYVGSRIGSLALEIQPEQIAQATWGIVGSSMTSGTAIIAGATYAAGSTNEKLTSLDTLSITLSGVTGSFDFESLSLSIDNNLTASKRLGPNATRAIRAGQVFVTSKARVYVDSNAFNDAYLAETAISLAFDLTIGGVGYRFTLANAKITGYTDNNTGNGNEFIADIDIESVLDVASATSLTVTKVG